MALVMTKIPVQIFYKKLFPNILFYFFHMFLFVFLGFFFTSDASILINLFAAPPELNFPFNHCNDSERKKLWQMTRFK